MKKLQKKKLCAQDKYCEQVLLCVKTTKFIKRKKQWNIILSKPLNHKHTYRPYKRTLQSSRMIHGKLQEELLTHGTYSERFPMLKKIAKQRSCLFRLCLFNKASVKGNNPQQAHYLSVCAGLIRQTPSPTLSSLKLPTAPLIPLFSAKSTLIADILVYWI